MKKEVLSAVDFLVDLLRINSTNLKEEQLIKFRKHACECLWQHYQDHWFPETPMKGSGYRCIRINGKMDPLIARAGKLVGFVNLRALFPSELTMWIDPREVAYRIGENGSICNIYMVNKSSVVNIPAASVETKAQQSPVKTTPPSSTQLTIQQLKHRQQQQQFSPSKNTVQFQSPPRSPVFNNSQQQQMSLQQQHNLAMFLMNNHTVGNCKDSLRSCALESSTRGMERLFVSS